MRVRNAPPSPFPYGTRKEMGGVFVSMEGAATCNPVQVRAVQARTSLKCSPSFKIKLLLISAKKKENTAAILAVHPVPTPSQSVRPFRTGSGTVQAGDSRTGRGLSGLFLLFIDSSLSLSLLVVSLAIAEKITLGEKKIRRFPR